MKLGDSDIEKCTLFAQILHKFCTNFAQTEKKIKRLEIKKEFVYNSDARVELSHSYSTLFVLYQGMRKRRNATMTYVKIQDINVRFVIKLIHKLSKTKDERFLSQIPFLIGICNFGFKKGYLTINQKTSVSSIYFEYQIFMKIKRNKSKGK